MSRLIDLTGKKFCRLTVIKRAENKKGKTYWDCICECGKEKCVCGSHLTSGKIVSCGCLSHEKIAKLSKTHGMSKTRIYSIWTGMKKRCYNKNAENYPIYGGRGIAICDEWINNFQSFYNWSIKNGYSDNLSIDRIDNNGNYGPSNCRFATAKEQSCNTRRTKLFEHNGEIKTLKQIAKDENLNYNTLIRKVSKNGIDINIAIYEIKNKIRTKIRKD